MLREFCARTGQNPPTVTAARAIDAEAEPFLHATAQLMAHVRARWPLVEYARVFRIGNACYDGVSAAARAGVG